MHGVLLINKPKGPTSHDVVNRLRRVARTRRVGHAGTLDPMATGLLVCCIGRATRIVPYLIGMHKQYTGEMVLGAASDTYDAEGTVTPVGDASGVTLEALSGAFRAQTGMIEQVAPPYSAVKVKGKKLYEYARAGEEAPIKKRTVWVERFEVLRYAPPRVTFAATVGSGTYIRSLAHEAGLALGCGAYLSQLCRTRVGGFELDHTAELDLLEADPESCESLMLSIGEALGHMPKMVLLPEAEMRLRHGTPFRLADIQECGECRPTSEPALVMTDRGEVLAIVKADASDGVFKPECVLVNPDD